MKTKMQRYHRFAAVALFIVGSLNAQNTFWPTTAVPTVKSVTNDSSPVTLGLPFYSSVAGQVLGGRFYKGANNPGPHVVALFDSNGKKLAQATTQAETADGWQTVQFAVPVTLTQQARYVIAYWSPKGGYADDQYYGWSALSRPPLHVASLTATPSSGTFSYGSAISFPAGTWNRSNYWVDVLFQQGTGPLPPPPPVPTPTPHSVTLSWTASVSPNITGYRVYVASTAGGPYRSLTGSLVTGTGYVDGTVTAGSTYFYVTTAVDASNAESGYSNEAKAVVPTP